MPNALLEFPLLARIRRNHGLEHATLHVLSRLSPGKPIAGHSDPGGFWILGDVPTETVQAAVAEALRRMQAGEHQLAVHPNCGTNFVTAGTMAGLAGVAGLLGVGERKRDKLERLPLVATLATLALLVSQPVGLLIQKHLTTSGLPGDLRVEQIISSTRWGLKRHRVITSG